MNRVFDVPAADPELKELLCQATPITYVDGEPRSYITEAGEILQAKLGQIISCVDPKKIRQFETGATRDTDTGKYDYEAFFSPLVLERRAKFMHQNRVQKDGSLRDGDNWQKGIPLNAYAKSEARHHQEFWKLHRGYPAFDEKGNPVDLEDAICALMFNLEGYLHEILKKS